MKEKVKSSSFFAKNYDVIARFQGGPNAGHTLYVNDKKLYYTRYPAEFS
jgi:adenylosuccinate synthase